MKLPAEYEAIYNDCRGEVSGTLVRQAIERCYTLANKRIAELEAERDALKADADVLGDALIRTDERLGHCLTALRYYASGDHFIVNDDMAWDTVSGEPQNFWCDEAGTATVEDGGIAALTLQGKYIDWTEDGESELPKALPDELDISIDAAKEQQ